MRRLTPTGWLFLGLSTLFYFAALTSQSSLLLLLIGVILGCLLVNGVAARKTLNHLALQVPPRIHLCEGERMTQPWKIINHGRHSAEFIQAESAAGLLFRVTRIPSGATAGA